MSTSREQEILRIVHRAIERESESASQPDQNERSNAASHACPKSLVSYLEKMEDDVERQQRANDVDRTRLADATRRLTEIHVAVEKGKGVVEHARFSDAVSSPLPDSFEAEERA